MRSTTSPRVCYLVEGGPITEDQEYPPECVGNTEWQISDAPPLYRGSSADFASMEEAVAWAMPRYDIIIPWRL